MKTKSLLALNESIQEEQLKSMLHSVDLDGPDPTKYNDRGGNT